MANRLRILEPPDVPQAFALSQTAGWNQTPDDWRLAIEMNPMGCFAIESDGALAATTTSIRYGTDLAWIGMVLTHPEFRGRGFARALMSCVLDHLSDIGTVKLDATEMGAHLYRKLGFVEECAIERWQGQTQKSTDAVKPFTCAAYDKEAFGADRSALLQRLARIQSASDGDAFAMARGNRFGPCVSPSTDSAMLLARTTLSDQPTVWDLFPENNIAQSLGFTLSRRLTRMTRGRKLESNSKLVYACAGFEFG
ncbi:MAG TPA: GNAT family N-acetyltransferase [Bryobacteraceae bacterium]|jgi:GNAT superfamily N-acetyltransferase|nr:GNAT family N-acetyltransferase [Bryobacteraceae bacterium]